MENKLVLPKLVYKTKRAGRGPSSGKGKTCGRGMNGQKSRNGANTTFREGGQTKLSMRLPKVNGFKPNTRIGKIEIASEFIVKNFKENETVSKEKILGILGEKDKVTRGNNIKIKVILSGKDIPRNRFSDDVSVSKSIVSRATAPAGASGSAESKNNKKQAENTVATEKPCSSAK